MSADEKKIIRIITVNFLIALTFIIIVDIYELNIMKSKVYDLNYICFAIVLKTLIAIIIFVVSIHVLITLFKKKLNVEGMTGLYTRRKLFIDLNDLINKKSKFALCYIDFDNLKTINDNYGHKAGDILINEFSRRINLLKYKKIKGYRIGGDEFIVIIKDSLNIPSCIESIWEITKKDVKISFNKSVKISFTMGTVENDFASTADDLLAKADCIMYRKKRT